MDSESSFYQDKGREESNACDSASVSEEHEGLVTGARLDRHAAGTRFRRITQLAPIFLLLSLTFNVLQIVYTVFRHPECVSLYAKIPENEINVPYQYSTEYGSNNLDEDARNALWNAIDISDGFVALTHQDTDALGLPRSEIFPWDSNKGMYLIHGYHALHCLTLVYAYTYDSSIGKKPLVAYHHVVHCLDLLRQDIMCHADDFLDYTAGPNDESLVGDNQPRKCRDWNKLSKWAKDHTSCYKSVNISRSGEDHGVEHQLDRYTHCPEGSPYKSIIEEWKYLNHPNPGNLDADGIKALTEAQIKADAEALVEHNEAVVGVSG